MIFFSVFNILEFYFFNIFIFLTIFLEDKNRQDFVTKQELKSVITDLKEDFKKNIDSAKASILYDMRNGFKVIRDSVATDVNRHSRENYLEILGVTLLEKTH